MPDRGWWFTPSLTVLAFVGAMLVLWAFYG